ncbi:MAG TPA: 50S ribosomal protein L11 methyltransferase [Syntrophales bacterium]|nr:50S ribosomal protein L11 methyltransferase [Syntrophales bacterium]HPI56686.1 50S ribosomal protein L11 methyltransferase [Syntrophales bacterium]HPN24888.1 50S ribosomal protein L11 methyltransferase [Syntrophales bacterium]HQM29697.1 50S ribosomal protein L11 methyltransferase [Syntrophales bacterium]
MRAKTEKAARGREKWVKFAITTPPELAEGLSNFLTEMGTQGVFQEELESSTLTDTPEPPSRIELNAFIPSTASDQSKIKALTAYINSISEMFPDLERPRLDTEIVVDPDWEEQWKKYFKPLRVTRSIVIKPTWERYQATSRDTVIDIDPGMAFGTGQHPSTWMCLEALEEILLKDRSFREWRVLDVGTGTGILGIAAAKLGAKSVMCVDIDPQAVEIAHQNVAVNRVGDRVVIINSDVVRIKGTFELIVANLTADTLVKIKSHLVKMMEPGGYLIISGIIEQNRKDIEKAFLKDKLTTHRAITDREWLSYVFKKPPRVRG